MQVQVRLFAICRERTGKDRLLLSLANGATVAQALEAIAAVEPSLAPLLPSLRVAVNQTFATSATKIEDGDELALIPPVSGGTGVVLAEIRSESIGLEEVEKAVRAPTLGAICSFVGTVRDHTGPHAVTGLDYEAYKQMAEKMLRLIGGEVCEQNPEARVAILHRVGHLDVGEVSVAIAVGSPHRAAAFEGCRHVIERLKEDAPIWKKELRQDGSVWVGTGS